MRVLHPDYSITVAIDVELANRARIATANSDLLINVDIMFCVVYYFFDTHRAMLEPLLLFLIQVTRWLSI